MKQLLKQALGKLVSGMAPVFCCWVRQFPLIKKEEIHMKGKVISITVAIALLLVAVQCAAPATPEVVEKIVKETVIVEKEVEVEVEKVVTQEVEKIVTQEVVVEVEKIVTPTPEPPPDLATTIRADHISEGGALYFETLIVKPFAEEMGIEIKVENGTYGNQEEWLASVRAAPGDYCIATYVSDFGLYNGVTQGLLEPFRLENMSNYANLSDKWEKRVIVEGDTDPYVATVDVGMYTFVYASDKILEKPSSYDPLFDPQYADRIALRDYGLYRIFQTASYLGLDPNNLSDEEVDLIFETMKQQRELARAYWQSSSQLDELLVNREIWIADYWFDTITRLDAEGRNKLDKLDIGWWFPEQGGPVWAGGPVIAAGCPEPQRTTAEMLINYMLRPDVYVEYASSLGFVPTLEEDKFDVDAYFATTPHRAAYRKAILETGVLIDVAKVVTHQEEWNERYEEMKLGQ
jgi:spermidine/putrescine-binding protein